MLLQVKVKNNFGTKHIYPDCETSKFYCEIAGTATITDSLYKLLSEKGYKFIQPEMEI